MLKPCKLDGMEIGNTFDEIISWATQMKQTAAVEGWVNIEIYGDGYDYNGIAVNYFRPETKTEEAYRLKIEKEDAVRKIALAKGKLDALLKKRDEAQLAVKMADAKIAAHQKENA